LKEILGDSYGAYYELIRRYEEPDYNLQPQWRYYNDGKAWLCKVVYKNKTVFWLSIWEGFFKTSFFFRERDCSGILGLDIDKSYKQQLDLHRHSGNSTCSACDKASDQLEDLAKN
jgi:hypothetical protein